MPIVMADPVDLEISPNKTIFNINNMVPGDSVGKNITLSNVGTETAHFVRISSESKMIVDGGKESNLRDVMFMNFTLENDQLKGSSISFEMLEKYGIVFARLEPNQEKKLYMDAIFSPQAGNKYQGDTLETNITFSAHFEAYLETCRNFDSKKETLDAREETDTLLELTLDKIVSPCNLTIVKFNEGANLGIPSLNKTI
ncbi:MAG: TasA family protein, partial [Candidatus Aenigmatarchaeota archaeon]